ncbi:MAG: hypothetical protein FGM58_05920 [Acidimicrobiia bacterium]|nr:hypothetical protein [Acidimicrobiia bacterium]
MTSTLHGSSPVGSGTSTVRPVLTWVPSADHGALDVAMRWHEVVTGSTLRASCVWTTRPLGGPLDHPAADELCWHVVDLPERLDRHLPNADGRAPWSPWGSKSGPNHQFFTMLDALGSEHPEEWVLFIEPDTHPVGDEVARRIGRLVGAHPDAWMIGGVPHPETRPSLSPDLWHHVNGAALYRVADPEFARFRDRVWIPTLLLRLRSEPRFAFDCATDPAQWEFLPSSLQNSWGAAASRFVRTAGIVNLSSMTIGLDRVTAALDDPRRFEGCDDRADPWMLHAKGELS